MNNIIEISQAELQEYILDLPRFLDVFSSTFALGGFCAGGSLVRACLSGSFVNAIRKADLTFPTGKPDIDFFFPEELPTEYSKIAPCIKESIYANNMSFNDYTRESMATTKSLNYSRAFAPKDLKIQFVNKNFTTVSETLRRFDINNCKIALTKDSAYVVENFFDLLREKRLSLNVDCKSFSKSEFLRLKRIKKYHLLFPNFIPTEEEKQYVSKSFLEILLCNSPKKLADLMQCVPVPGITKQEYSLLYYYITASTFFGTHTKKVYSDTILSILKKENQQWQSHM